MTLDTHTHRATDVIHVHQECSHLLDKLSLQQQYRDFIFPTKGWVGGVTVLVQNTGMCLMFVYVMRSRGISQKLHIVDGQENLICAFGP